MFPPGALIDEEAGRRVAAWAAGGDSGAMTKMLSAFAKIGVTQDDLRSKLGHDPTDADLDSLRAYHKERKSMPVNPVPANQAVPVNQESDEL